MKDFTININSVTSITNLFLGARIPMELSKRLFEISRSLSRLETLTLQTVTSLVSLQFDYS